MEEGNGRCFLYTKPFRKYPQTHGSFRPQVLTGNILHPDRSDNHVLYRVTPVFKGAELLARGVELEAFSVEDEGEGICFNVFIYNIQPGVEIDYRTGESRLEE